MFTHKKIQFAHSTTPLILLNLGTQPEQPWFARAIMVALPVSFVGIARLTPTKEAVVAFNPLELPDEGDKGNNSGASKDTAELSLEFGNVVSSSSESLVSW